jgi:hypothetical protein
LILSSHRLSARPSAPLLLILLPDWSPFWIWEEQRAENPRFFAASPQQTWAHDIARVIMTSRNSHILSCCLRRFFSRAGHSPIAGALGGEYVPKRYIINVHFRDIMSQNGTSSTLNMYVPQRDIINTRDVDNTIRAIFAIVLALIVARAHIDDLG